MRIETPMDRAQNRCRKAAILLERQEEIQKKSMEDVMGNPEAWEAVAIVIPEAALKPSTEKAEGNSIGGLKDSTVNFLNGFGVGALFMTVTVLVMIALYFLS